MNERILSESEIRNLLHDDPSPAPTPEELARIRARLELHDSRSHSAQRSAAAAGGRAEPATDITYLAVEGPKRRKRRTTATIMAASAAAVVVLLALIRLLGPPTELDGLRTADEVTEAEPGGQLFCTTEMAPLVDAVDAWRGVAGWAYIDGVTDRRLVKPDLALLASDALTALKEDEFGHTVDVSLSRLSELDTDEGAEVGYDGSYRWSDAKKDAYFEAIETAIATLETEIARRGWQQYPGCN